MGIKQERGRIPTVLDITGRMAKNLVKPDLDRFERISQTKDKKTNLLKMNLLL